MIQRVTTARVRVGDEIVGAIGHGLVVLLGVGVQDGPADVQYVASKIRELRIFEDDQGKMNRSIQEVGGQVLIVSQFTLFGDCRRGRRPSFIEAAGAELGRALYADVVRELGSSGLHVETGTFQAHMGVELTNDGPVTILLDSKKEF